MTTSASSVAHGGEDSGRHADRVHPNDSATPKLSATAWLLPAVLGAGAVLAFGHFLFTGDVAGAQVAVALALTAAPLLLVAIESPGRLLHPLSVFAFTMLLGIAGQTIYLNYIAEDMDKTELLSGLPTATLTSGLLVVGVAVLGLVLGYLLASRPGFVKPGPILGRAVELGLARSSPRRVFWAVSALCLISLAAFALYVPQVASPSQSLLTSEKRFVDIEGGQTIFGYYRWLISLTGTGFVLAVYTIVQNRRPWRSALGLVALVSLLLTILTSTYTSSRIVVASVLATAAFVAIALRQREPSAAKIVAAGAIAIVALSVLFGLRVVNQDDASSFGETFNVQSVVRQAIGSRDWMDIGPLSAVVERVPDAYDYRYGGTLASALIAPVPRTLWPDKPQVRLGPLIGPSVYKFSTDRRGGDPPGIVGELWINGGIIGVITGSLIFGLLLRRVGRWYQLSPATGGLSALVYGVFVVALSLRLAVGDVTGTFLALLLDVPTLLVLLWLTKTRGATRTGESRPAQHSIGRGQRPAASGHLTRTPSAPPSGPLSVR